MKFHIVSSTESIEDILFTYNITKDELKKENKHIRMWDRLIPGTKLKIPVITEAINQDILDMEPFIEDYYPKLKADFEEEKFAKEEQPIVEEKEIILSEEIKPIKEEEIKINNIISEDTKPQEVIEEKTKKDVDEVISKYSSFKKIRPVYVLPQYPVNPYLYGNVIYVIPRKNKHF